MHDRKLTPEMAAIIKLARQLKINYSIIASYLVINQGRIADVMKGRLFRYYGATDWLYIPDLAWLKPAEATPNRPNT